MKKFIAKLLVGAAIMCVAIGVYWQLTASASAKYYGINTEDQICTSFANAVAEEYNCYFLGNSRIYRDINPDMFTSVNAYNFAHDNESYNQMYYKLLYLIEHNKNIEHLIIGTDYFQFSFLADTRNYVYSKLFPREYMDDFGENNWIEEQADNILIQWGNKRNILPSVIKYILGRPTMGEVPYMKENGQYIVHGAATGKEKIDRDYSILDVQYNYYLKIIEACKENNIELYVLMPPLWQAELETHTEKERSDFNEFILGTLEGTAYENNYYNCSEIAGLSEYTRFIDSTHLKPEAADEFSKYVNCLIFENN